MHWIVLSALLLNQVEEPERLPLPRIIEHWPKELAPALVMALADPDADVQQYARAALINMGDEAIPGLIEGLRSPHAEARRLAAAMLGDIGASAGLPALIQALQDPSPEVRKAAAYALSQIIASQPPGE